MGFLKSIQKLPLGKAALSMALKSPFYEWSTRNQPIPDRLLIKPVDPWCGDKHKAQELCESTFLLNTENWESLNLDHKANKLLHSFIWLRDLRTLGTNQAKEAARTIAQSWMQSYKKWNKNAWNSESTAIRICMWLTHYNFLDVESPDETFQDLYFLNLIHQTNYLRKLNLSTQTPRNRILILKALIFSSLTLGNDEWLYETIQKLGHELDSQIHYDGGHISRAPDKLLAILQHLIDIRTLFMASTHESPTCLNDAISRAVPAVKFYRHPDKRFALFGGTQKGDADIIDTILAQAGIRSKALLSLPQTGYEKAIQGRGTLIMDTGCNTAQMHYHGHASPLAFEYSYGKERIFTSCGNHPTDSDWQHALSQTPAHTTATLNDQSAQATQVLSERQDTTTHSILHGRHNGYIKSTGLLHERTLYLAQQGKDLRGEENFIAEIEPSGKTKIAVRFHLHPNVQISLINNGTEALLKLKSTNSGWRFKQVGGTLSLENSIYLGEGSTPRKTKQLTIHAQTNAQQTTIKWAMMKEG